MEGGCQVFNQLAEVHALVGDIIEDGLLAVALIFHVANLHLQTQVLGNLTTLNHRLVLASLGLVIFVHVHLAGQAIHALNLLAALQVGLLHLQGHQSSCQCHHADVVTRAGLHGHDVAFLQWQVVHVVIVAFAGVLKLHLHQVGRLSVARHVGQPVVGVQLAVLSSHGSAAESAVTTCTYLVCSLFLFHLYLFLNEQYNHFQGKVEEHDLCVGVLTDVAYGQVGQVVELQDVGLVDKAGEVLGKVLLLLRHIYQLLLLEVIHEVLAQHAEEELQEALLLLTAKAGHRLAPFAKLANATLVGQSHQHHKHVEKLLVLRACLQGLHGLEPRAVGQSTDALGGIVADASTLHQCLTDGLVVYLLHVDALHTTANGLQQFVGLLAHHQEHRLGGGLLNQFQQLVGAFYVHALWQPDDAHLIAALTRLQRQLSHQLVALAGCDDGLLVLSAHGCEPLVQGEVGALHHQVVPLVCKVVAHGFVVAAHRWQLDGGVGEVQVGVLQLRQHRVFRLVHVLVVLQSQQIAAESHGQRHLSAAGRAAQHHGVWQAVFLDHLHQALLHLFLSYYFAELQFFCLLLSAVILG